HSWPGRYEAFMDPAVPAATSAVGFVEVPWRDNPVLAMPEDGQGPSAPSMAALRASSDQDRVPDPAAIHPPAYYGLLAVAFDALGLDRSTPNGAVLALRVLS